MKHAILLAALLILPACKPGAVGAAAGRSADDAAEAAATGVGRSADEAAPSPAVPDDAPPASGSASGPAGAAGAAAARGETEPRPVFELPMRLVGTEPFWGGRIARDGITISGADRPDTRFPYRDPVVTGAGARFQSQSAGAFPLEITLVRETCSDGMSDKRYPFEATVVLGKETLKGCAIREAEFGGER